MSAQGRGVGSVGGACIFNCSMAPRPPRDLGARSATHPHILADSVEI